MYDIFFISYRERNADESFLQLKHRFPTVKRVHGIKGIHNAHLEAAKKSLTKMFWVVDADAQITDEFNFSFKADVYNLKTVHIWSSINPINDLIYGYGGVKLLPRELTINMNLNSTDMTTSISKELKIMSEVSNITAFNIDPFSTWRSAFRECVKLSSRAIDRQQEEETDARLETWTTVGSDRKFGEFSISGACAGREYGHACRNNPDALRLINDFNWLEKRFKEA